MINSFIEYNPNIQLIVSDYGSDDGIEEFVKQYKHFDYVYTEPNEGQYFNISKCNNNAFKRTKNNIIFTNSIDWRYSYDFLLSIEPHFRKLGDIILEVPIAVLEKDGVFKSHIYIPVFLKKHLLLAGGWDERIYNWGQDDRDVMYSLIYGFNILKYSFVHKNFCIYHLWHENNFYKIGGKEQNKKNIEVLTKNVNEKRKNIVNSYWRFKNE